MAKYSHGSRSSDDPGDDCHDYVSTTVNRSTRLKCVVCGASLPMGSTAVFELDAKGLFVAVYCDNDDCPPLVHQMDDGRHPFDLED